MSSTKKVYTYSASDANSIATEYSYSIFFSSSSSYSPSFVGLHLPLDSYTFRMYGTFFFYFRNHLEGLLLSLLRLSFSSILPFNIDLFSVLSVIPSFFKVVAHQSSANTCVCPFGSLLAFKRVKLFTGLMTY